MNIASKILQAAKPSLEGKVVTDLVIGISLIACQLDSGEVGVSYVLRDNLPSGCSAFQFAKEVIGKKAVDAAESLVTGGNDIERSIACSVLCAATQSLDIPDDASKMPFAIDYKKDDTVGMIGLIRPTYKMINNYVDEIIVFDRTLEELGQAKDMLSPCDKQSELLAECDIVVLSGTTTINGTIDDLLKMCTNTREVVLVGPSSEMYAHAFKGTPVTKVAGSWWKNENKDDIFKAISLGGGVMQISKYMEKKVLMVP